MLLLFACDNKLQKEYFESGELKCIIEQIDKSGTTYYCKEFFKNGEIKAEGKLDKDGVYFGKWKEYFSDGALKWDGYFSSGQIVVSRTGKWPDFTKIEAKLEIRGNPLKLKVGNIYQVRSVVEGIHPSLYYLTDSQYNKLRESDIEPECYPYVYIPKSTGKTQIWIVFPDENGVFKIGDKRLAFDIIVVK